MSLDREPMSVSEALVIAKKYYTEDGYNHALRVMQYVADNDMIGLAYKNDCLVLAVMHDLLEDTEYNGVGAYGGYLKALQLLTKPKDMDYIEYIKEIRRSCNTNWGMCAYWVKLADMKDHLSQTETLTDRLKEKYLRALPYLL